MFLTSIDGLAMCIGTTAMNSSHAKEISAINKHGYNCRENCAKTCQIERNTRTNTPRFTPISSTHIYLYLQETLVLTSPLTQIGK